MPRPSFDHVLPREQYIKRIIDVGDVAKVYLRLSDSKKAESLSFYLVVRSNIVSEIPFENLKRKCINWNSCHLWDCDVVVGVDGFDCAYSKFGIFKFVFLRGASLENINPKIRNKLLDKLSQLVKETYKIVSE